ncbi:apoptosis regulation protein [Sporothrix schenckii 1099-18]|uniref:RRM domain-containing protein n=2 Tax=Sporothrix schenckii TaxID=29908 RepID=U7PHD5_SPOS1|nr:apoptosis regulation protein [Sporothrix schenckii 1099-18]ERS94983.1 hypothetical protein HMPREF1624_08695 [Sporothrix schenckii ATCC 58251]KJR83911.1 apoptosis regulation protein [Sporothrix schenckii 1099-18]
MTDTPRWKATIYVGGLGPQVTLANLHDAFIPFGDIADVSLPKNDRHGKIDRVNGTNEDSSVADADADTSSHRGFAYVEFEDADDATEAIDNMDKSEFFGRNIKVMAAKAPKTSSEGLGSRTALWNQEAWIAQSTAAEDGQLATKLGSGNDPEATEDSMQGLEGLDVAGPRPE